MCDALTKADAQCRRRVARCRVPTVVGRYDAPGFLYGRTVRLCWQHWQMRWCHTRRPMQLIEGGWLQPYNQYGYGNAVFDRPIDWINPPEVLQVPLFWWRKEQEGE